MAPKFQTETITTATHQIVGDAHCQVVFSYAWDKSQATQEYVRMCANGRKNVQVRDRGEFVPHYPDED